MFKKWKYKAYNDKEVTVNDLEEIKSGIENTIIWTGIFTAIGAFVLNVVLGYFTKK